MLNSKMTLVIVKKLRPDHRSTDCVAALTVRVGAQTHTEK
jgi:hypothetical protein